jgi:PQQ-like domain
VGEDIRAIVVSGNTLFADSEANWLIAYGVIQHRELWRQVTPEGSANTSPIVVDGAAVYVVHINGHIVGYSAGGPKILWDIGDYRDGFLGTVAVGPDRLFLSGITGFWAIQK